MGKTRNLDLTQGSVTKKLIAFAVPILLTNVLQHLYTVADRVVVGQFAENGKLALAAVGATGSATTLFLNVFNGLAVGANVICANRRGAQDREGLERCTHSSMLLSIVIGLCVAVLGILACKPLLTLMGTPDDILNLSGLYMRLYFLGIPAASIYAFGANILRAHGDTKRPMMILGISGLVNVVLNLILVIGFHMSVAGVAIATIAAQYVSAIWVVCILVSRKGEYKMSFCKLRFHGESMRSVVRVGIPSGLNGMVFTVSNLILQSALNGFGSAAIAGKTAALDISTLVYQGIGACYLACISFSGQCYGARQYKRIDTLLLRGTALCIGYVSVMATICTLFPKTLLGLFNSDPEVIRIGTSLLLINSWGYILYATSETALGCLRGMGKSGVPMILNFIGICLPRIVWVLAIFPLKQEITFLYLCYPISWVISASLQLGYYFHCRKKLPAEQ